jgi:hypothetical protein
MKGVISVPHLSTTLKLQIYSNKTTIKLFFYQLWGCKFWGCDSNAADDSGCLERDAVIGLIVASVSKNPL